MLVSDIRAQLRDICVKVTCCHTVFACFICILLFVPKLISRCTKSQKQENMVVFSVSHE